MMIHPLRVVIQTNRDAAAPQSQFMLGHNSQSALIDVNLSNSLPTLARHDPALAAAGA
jgi:hypothetical protein